MHGVGSGANRYRLAERDDGLFPGRNECAADLRKPWRSPARRIDVVWCARFRVTGHRNEVRP